MQKTKKTPKPTPEAPETGEQDLFELSLGYLRTQIKLVIDGKAAKTKHDPAYRVASLARMAAQVEAERRKARAADEKKLERISRPLVMAWLRTLSREECESIGREAIA